MKIIPVFLALMYMLVIPIYANTNSACIDAVTLQSNTTLSISGSPLEISENKTCEYGCADSQCTPAATLNSSNSIFLILLFAALLIGGGAAENVFIVGLSGPIGVLIGLSLWSEGILIGNTLLNNTYTSGIGLMFMMVSIYLSFGAYIDYRGRKEI